MTEKEHIDEPNTRDRGEFDWDRFGRILKHYRSIKSLTLEETMLRSGVPLTNISNGEKGRPLSVDNLIALCVMMDINPTRLHSKYVPPEKRTVAKPVEPQQEPTTPVSPLSLFEP